MRHRVKGKKLNRNASHRKAMFRNLVLGLLAKYDADGSNGGRIVTTLPKAKAVRPIVDKLITLGKRAALVLASLPVVPDKSSPEWLKWRSSPDWQVWAKAVAPAVCMRRRAFALLRSDRAVRVLFDDVALRFVDRLGGYTRVIRLPSYRVGDASRLAVLEFAIGSRRV